MNNKKSGLIVTVILATYNGSRYLPAQLESLARQTVRPTHIVVRDDGSVDGSLALVKQWAERQDIACQVITGPNLGPARSFLTATTQAADSDYYFFCDQDDVWLDDKIERAVTRLGSAEQAKPMLYASRLQVVDQELQPLRESELPSHLSFSSAAYESLLTGCTMAFNRTFRALLSTRLPEFVLMHDWWCYLLATGVEGAELVYDDRPTILYRQHATNAVGAGPTGFKAIKTRLKGFVSAKQPLRFLQLQEFSRLHEGRLSATATDTVRRLRSARCNPWVRPSIALSLPIERQTFSSVLSTRLTILINRY